MMGLLKDMWQLYTLQFGASKAVMDKYWIPIETRYSEPQRHYHTLNHLEEMFEHFTVIQAVLKQPALVAMAIFFHDVIYNPTEKDNEEQSAELFLQFAQEFKSPKDQNTEDVFDWIMATKSHMTDVTMEKGNYGDTDMHYLLDIDMAILASSPERYVCYAKEIRQEYIHIADIPFAERRAKVLKTFLERCNIYNTRHFREKCEETARHNLTEEIKRLEKGEL